MAKPAKKNKKRPEQNQHQQRSVVKKDQFIKHLSISVFIFGFFLYLNTVKHDYALDDIAIINANKYTQLGIQGIPDLISKGYWHGFNGSNDNVYRPVAPVTFALEYELWDGENPGFSHFINALIYSLTGVLLFFTLRQLFEKFNYLLPLVITLLYIAHPIHTESVANIKSRDEMLSFVGMIASLSFMLGYQSETPNKLKYLLFACISFMFAMLSKESSITFVGIVPLVFFFIKKEDLKKCVVLTMPVLATALLYLMIRGAILDTITGEVIDVKSNTIAIATNYSDRLATAVLALGWYFRLLVFPHPLSHDYSYNQIPINTWGDPYAILSLLLYISFVSFIVYAAKKCYDLRNTDGPLTFPFLETTAFGIGFYLITMSIVSNVFLLIGSNLAERFLYSPSLGFSIVTGVLLLKLTKADVFTKNIKVLSNVRLVIILILILIGYSCKTISRNMSWKDNYTLFLVDINTAPNSTRINNALGSVLTEQASEEKDEAKRREITYRAIPYINRAIEIYPDYIDAHFNLGTAFGLLGENEKAIEMLNKSVGLGSTYWKTYNNLGIIYTRLNQFDKAIPDFKKALQYNPENYSIYYQMADAYRKAGNAQQSIKTYKELLRLKPNDELVFMNIGQVYYESGNVDEAINWLKKIVQVNPGNADAYLNLGGMYQAKGDAENSKKYFEKAFQINPALRK